jgi:hypothetical protein
VTIGISELIGQYVQPVSTVIFSLLRNRAAESELDYLQKLSINGTMCWCIDDGDSVTILLPSEY